MDLSRLRPVFPEPNLMLTTINPAIILSPEWEIFYPKLDIFIFQLKEGHIHEPPTLTIIFTFQSMSEPSWIRLWVYQGLSFPYQELPLPTPTFVDIRANSTR